MSILHLKSKYMSSNTFLKRTRWFFANLRFFPFDILVRMFVLVFRFYFFNSANTSSFFSSFLANKGITTFVFAFFDLSVFFSATIARPYLSRSFAILLLRASFLTIGYFFSYTSILPLSSLSSYCLNFPIYQLSDIGL
jgi:hypothetical protein